MAKVASVAPRSKLEIENLTEKILEKYDPESLKGEKYTDVEKIFECNLESICKVQGIYEKLPYYIHGYTDTEIMAAVVSLSAIDTENLNFGRSTIAHEMGHAILHVHQYRSQKIISRLVNSNEKIKLFRQDDLPAYCNPEWQAWHFAGSILMPKQKFIEHVERGLNDEELSKIFMVNIAFIKRRKKSLGVN